jgi:hypothetical protein
MQARSAGKRNRMAYRRRVDSNRLPGICLSVVNPICCAAPFLADRPPTRGDRVEASMTRAFPCWAALAALVALSPAALAADPYPPVRTLAAFRDDAEIQALFKKWARELEAQRRAREQTAQGTMQNMAPPASAPAPLAAKAEAEKDAITNVQHAGVDEGGIVKVHGDHLVILRRGRLFTVAIGGDRLAPVSMIDAFAPGSNPGGTWYDEMLISGNRIAVIGYSYGRGGTEVGMFEIAPNGMLSYKSTHHLRSNDYYSSRNYASRLIGSKLVLYSPLVVHPSAADPLASVAAVRRWRPDATPADFKRIAPATRIYRADDTLDPSEGMAFHSVTTCDVAQPELDCESTTVLAPAGRVFYVSPSGVYVWATPWRRLRGPETSSSTVFRIPLDGSAPSALRVAGSPIDQFSFLEGSDGRLNVLVRSNGRGDGMWAAEMKGGELALLRVALSSFSDGRDAAPPTAYASLPSASGGALQNRFIGSYLLYGAGTGWSKPRVADDPELFAVQYARSAAAYALPLKHSVDRIEALGANAVVVGSDGANLHFTSVNLARSPMVASSYVRANAAQGETRSHGFFYKPDGDNGGLLGLPVMGGSEPGWRHLRRESAAVLFLRNKSLALSEIGALSASSERTNASDGCKASCVDWYGNSRPIFLRGRVLALLGYEIVEGRVGQRSIEEVKRISFAPVSLQMSAR